MDGLVCDTSVVTRLEASCEAASAIERSLSSFGISLLATYQRISSALLTVHINVLNRGGGTQPPIGSALVSWLLIIPLKAWSLVWSDSHRLSKKGFNWVYTPSVLFRVELICLNQDSPLFERTSRYVTNVLQKILLPLSWNSSTSLSLLTMLMFSNFFSIMSRLQLVYLFWRTRV